MSLLQRLNRRFKLRYRLEYAAALFLVYGLRAMSPRFVWATGRGIGRLLFRLGLRRAEILRNLTVAFPELAPQERWELGRRCMEHFLSMGVDILFQRRMLTRRNLFRRVEFVQWARDYLDEHGIDGLQRRAHGVLFLTAHLGNWELASGIFSLLGVKITPVFRRLKNPYMDGLLRRIRLEAQGGVIERRGAVSVMVDHLATGGNIGFLFDQEATHGPYIPFFGLPARTHKTPAVLARDNGVKIFFGWMLRRGDFFDYQARGELLDISAHTGDRHGDIEEITTELMRRLEQEIRLAPEQYFWMHRRWKRSGVHGAEYLPEKRK